MKKQLTAALFCISTLLTTPVLASNQHILTVSPAIDYELPVNEPQIISNVFRWTITADCTILKSNATSTILFKILRKKGTLNDITLSRGESLRLTMQPDETFHIVAIPGSSVELTNEGDMDITARCTTSSPMDAH
ncbi:MAG: hypothetical protein P1U61_05045 [Legionellaceae bacterium]|nr:hypothetical protein [Legionellaceae bacterium]